MEEPPTAPNRAASGTRQAATAARWLGEVVLFTALGLVWAAFGYIVLDLLPSHVPSYSLTAWMALGAFGYGVVRPIGSTLGGAVFLAACIVLIPHYFMAGWRDADLGPAYRLLTPAEFAMWLRRGNSNWFGEGPERFGAPWLDGSLDVLRLAGPIALGLLSGRLVGRRLRSPRQTGGPKRAPAD